MSDNVVAASRLKEILELKTEPVAVYLLRTRLDEGPFKGFQKYEP